MRIERSHKTPEVSIITNVGIDHVKTLGGTKELIARQKAGIIKQGRPAVIGSDLPLDVIKEYLAEINHNSTLTIVPPDDNNFTFDQYNQVFKEISEKHKGIALRVSMAMTGYHNVSQNIKLIMNYTKYIHLMQCANRKAMKIDNILQIAEEVKHNNSLGHVKSI